MSTQVRTRVRRSLTIGAVTSVLALGALPALAADGGTIAVSVAGPRLGPRARGGRGHHCSRSRGPHG